MDKLQCSQGNVDREPATKGDDLLETSLRVLRDQEDELQEAREEKERTERENRQLRHQMENLCTDLGINRYVHVYLTTTSLGRFKEFSKTAQSRRSDLFWACYAQRR